ncbi:MAG: HAD family hydrolase [Candidatus Limnocylindrales bacterium]
MRAIIFDWNGTLVDSMAAIRDTEAAICRELGLPFDDAIFKNTFSPNQRIMWRQLGVPDDRTGDAARIWAETFRQDLMPLFPGVRAALVRLAAAGCTLGVVSSGDRGEVEPQLTRLGIAALVAVGVYADDTDADKPDPRPLLLALRRAGAVGAEDGLYIGDSLDDMRMASAAGVRGIGLVSDIASAEELLAVGAFEVANSVVEWVDRFLRSPEPSGGRRSTGASSPAPDHVEASG